MKPFRLLSGLGLGLLAAGSLAGCIAEPHYSSVPEISRNQETVALTTNKDGDLFRHLELTINYQDGDGDLGLSDDEAGRAPYLNTRFASNFFIEPYVKNPSVYVPLADAHRVPNYVTGRYNQRFDHATAAADNHSLPIKGTLTLTYDFYSGDTFPGKGETVEFHISIADRAQHESNVLIIPVTFPQ